MSFNNFNRPPDPKASLKFFSISVSAIPPEDNVAMSVITVLSSNFNFGECLPNRSTYFFTFAAFSAVFFAFSSGDGVVFSFGGGLYPIKLAINLPLPLCGSHFNMANNAPINPSHLPLPNSSSTFFFIFAINLELPNLPPSSAAWSTAAALNCSKSFASAVWLKTAQSSAFLTFGASSAHFSGLLLFNPDFSPT